MTNRSKSAKKGWHTRKVKNKYKEMCDSLEKDSEVIEVLDKHKQLFIETQIATNEIVNMRLQYEELLANVSKSGNVMENLPIESIRDCIEFEKHGRPLKGRFGDILEAGQIRRKALQLQEETEDLAQKAQIAKIELTEAACNALIRLLDNEDKEKH